MTVEENIEAALFGLVRDLELSQSIAWPNVKFEPTVGTAHVEVSHLKNRNRRLFLKGSDPHMRQGILQLLVVSPLGAGAEQATAIAGAIAAGIAADTELFSESVKVKIQSAPDVGSAALEDASWNVPISIRYEAFA